MIIDKLLNTSYWIIYNCKGITTFCQQLHLKRISDFPKIVSSFSDGFYSFLSVFDMSMCSSENNNFTCSKR